MKAFKDIIEAANFNGDSIKGVWVAQVAHTLTLELQNATIAAQELISRVFGTKSVLKLLEQEQSDETFTQLTKRLIELKLMERFAVDVKQHLLHMCDIYVELWNNVYVASSVNLIDAFNEQLKNDTDFNGSKLMFEVTEDDQVTTNTLTVESMPIRMKLALIYRDVYSDNWFINTIIQSLRSQFQLSSAIERANALVVSRQQTILNVLKVVAFNVAQESVVKATEQLSSMGVEFNDDQINP
jgi:hypothetical protein